MSSARRKVLGLEESIRKGGRYEKSFGGRKFVRFTPERIQEMKAEIERLYKAHAPKMFEATEDIRCEHEAKKGYRCNTILFKKGGKLPAGTTILKCSECGTEKRATISLRK